MRQAILRRWPNCITPDCSGKSCLSLDSRYCYPCATGLPRDSSGTAIHAPGCNFDDPEPGPCGLCSCAIVRLGASGPRR